jgi:hypothetical protein
MAGAKVSQKRARLLAQLEYIVGNNCYNGNIQNWGTGGTYEGEGVLSGTLCAFAVAMAALQSGGIKPMTCRQKCY